MLRATALAACLLEALCAVPAANLRLLQVHFPSFPTLAPLLSPQLLLSAAGNSPSNLVMSLHLLCTRVTQTQGRELLPVTIQRE